MTTLSVNALKLPRLNTKNFLHLAQFSADEIAQLLDLALTLKRDQKQGTAHPILAGKSIGMYFEKPSNRTRVSFEVGIHQLGAQPIMLHKAEINLGVRETIEDTARTLSRYVDGMMIRTFAHKDLEDFAAAASIPLINGLTDDHHPCQVMADLLTVRERFGSLKGHKLVYVGDGNNMANSLLEGCALSGMDVVIACPEGYTPATQVLDWAKQHTTGQLVGVEHDVLKAAEGASVIYTDVWASMGQEAEAEARKQIFKAYQVNEALMAKAKPDAIVLHCLPAHRGEEITHETLERFAEVIFDQAENRLHAQKAIMAALMG
jgi:ornithine carbamoyltransferase